MKTAATFFIFVGFWFFQGCVLEKIADPVSTDFYKLSRQPVTLATANGLESDNFYDFETVFVDAFDLEPIRQYCIEVSLVKNTDPFLRKIVVSDSLGRILNLPILYDIGFDPLNNNPILPDYYEVRIQGWNRSPFIRLVKRFKVIAGPRPNVPHVLPTTAAGDYNGGTVLAGGELFARGNGFPASTDVRIYVVDDKDAFNEGDPLADISGGFETVTTNAAGELPNALIWAGVSASPGTALDLIGDLPPFGVFNATDALREAKLAGVVVQNPPAATDIITELAANVDGIFQDVFGDTEVIMTRANPPQQPLLPNPEAGIYIVIHQDSWQAGDRLVAVAKGIRSSQEMPNFECVRLLSGGKPVFPIHQGPGVAPGRYDVIVDIGRNFVYDPGTDFLDGGLLPGFTIPGAIDSVRLIASFDMDFLPEDGSTRLYAKLIRDDDSPIPDVLVKFRFIDEAEGSLSVTSAITGIDGVAYTIYSAGNIGDVDEIEVKATVGDMVLTENVSIWTKVSLHNQGSISSGH